MTERLDPSRWGIASGYHDIAGTWHEIPQDVQERFLVAMGAEGDEPPPAVAITVRTDRQLPPLGAGRIVFEDGGEITISDVPPPDIPTGYHRLVRADGQEVPLIVSPGQVPYPEGRHWGFATQLYATRSSRSWGIGDLADLARLGRWSKGLGAGFALVNPLHAATPGATMQPSPYYPGSRCFLNPIYIAVDAVPGAAATGQVEVAAASGRALDQERLIDRDRAWELKSWVLEQTFERNPIDADFEQFVSSRGRPLWRFATYCALAETHGPDWRKWPVELRHPSGAAVAGFGADPAGLRRIRYHAWLQWVLDFQLAEAGASIDLIADLAVGIDPSGPDAWVWHDTFTSRMRVGAPPDEFNTLGQDWGLLPFDPWRLRTAMYEPYLHALRAGFRHAAGLRIDHVMGLFRLYWIPDGSGPAEGGYVHYPHHDMLNILALEAERAGAYVVGEDLGTVGDEVRADLAERRIMSYKVWWFEDTPPSTWAETAMASVTTHDLPTVAGVVTGSDLDAQRRLDMRPNEESSAGLVAKVEACAGPGAGPLEATLAVYADLASAPCALLTVGLDDALAVEERANMPGTVDEWPNWRIALPLPLEQIRTAELPARIAGALNGRAGRTGP